MNALVIDLGIGNLGSVRRSLEECGATVLISDDPRDLETASNLILPGVGSYAAGMSNLRTRGWFEPLHKAVIEQRVPLLGICLGMQFLADRAEEGGDVEGRGLIPGRVERIVPVDGERVPHMGWNEVRKTRESFLLEGVPDGSDFYFIHSYHFGPERECDGIARTPYGGGFVSAVESGHVCGVQFHPEKSSRHGRRLLRNFLEGW